MKEVTIDVDANGDVTIEGKGFEGTECKDVTREIEEALGKVEKVVEKPEMRRTKAAKVKATR